MGAAKRVDGYPWLASEPSSNIEPELEVAEPPEWGWSDWGEVEQTDPWCVDDGERIVVMRTRDIQRGIQRGALPRHVKVWRDGRACWLPVDEVYELRASNEDSAPSRIRRVRRSSLAREEAARATRTWGTQQSWWRRTMLMIFGGLVLGAMAMILLTPRARTEPRLEPVVADVSDAVMVAARR